MRKLDHIPPALQTSLTEFQIAWLGTQAQAMNIPCERLTGTILAFESSGDALRPTGF
ncbi:MAG TPA: hypothetical protein VFO40_29305 [Chthoniobacterales bacterium]|nr:hypothetical protein [Chthoniobacterales bacterium]